MKKTRLLILTLTSLVLSGCNFNYKFWEYFKKKPNNDTPTTEEHVHEDKDHNHLCDGCGIKISDHIDQNNDHLCDICGRDDRENQGLFIGGLVDDGVHHGYEYVKEDAATKRPTSGTEEVVIYGFNDFHGTIKETPSDYEIGLARFASFVKEKTHEENTLVFDQGDTWQGSFESNFEHGGIIQKAMAAANLSARTVGNHDFDWGISQLETAAKTKYGEYTVPMLAANVYNYDWDRKVEGRVQQKNVGQEYATYILDNGLKVGVVGVIGKSQITSISTQFVKDICFTDHIKKIKEMSDYLRSEKKCDIIVATCHGSKSETMYNGLSDTSSKTNKRYVDLVLNGHSHYEECGKEGGVLHSQQGCNSKYIGAVTLRYDFANQKVLNSSYDDRTSLNYTDIVREHPVIDSEINSMVNDYLDSISDVGTEVLSSKFTGYFGKTEQLPNLMCEAIYNEAQAEGYNVSFAVVNQARDTLTSETMTYSDLYRCFPFDNEVIIMDVKGYKSARSIASNFSYHNDLSIESVSQSQTYRIACIDYVALHTNSSREYDYFPKEEMTEISVLSKDGKHLTYRDVLYNYLKVNPTKSFNSEDYASSNDHFYVNY